MRWWSYCNFGWVQVVFFLLRLLLLSVSIADDMFLILNFVAGSLILMEKDDSILWSLQVDHNLFALSKLDVTVINLSYLLFSELVQQAPQILREVLTSMTSPVYSSYSHSPFLCLFNWLESIDHRQFLIASSLAGISIEILHVWPVLFISPSWFTFWFFTLWVPCKGSVSLLGCSLLWAFTLIHISFFFILNLFQFWYVTRSFPHISF